MAGMRTPRRPAATMPASPTIDVARWTPLVRVRGRSMQPTLEHGQLLLTRPAFRRVKVGDIVVLTAGRNARHVKRIAAGPGDVVELEAGRLFVNQQAQDGRPRSAGARVETWHVPTGHFFVVGDNPLQSDDSRVWPEPFVAESRIIGVALPNLLRTPGRPPPRAGSGTACGPGRPAAR